MEKSKSFIEIIRKQTPQAHIAVIANKQDLEDAMGSYQIEGILGLKVYPMIAIDTANQKKMRQIIIDLLNMTDEIFQYSMLLEEKEKLILELEQLKNDNNYNQTSFIAKKLTNVYAKLGDDALRDKYSDLARKMDEKILNELKTQEILSSDKELKSKELKPQKISHTETVLKALIKNYMNDIKSIMAVIIFDRSGFIITSESKIESDDNLEIEASVIKMPLMFGMNKELETHNLRVICPTCKQSKKISVPKSIVKEAENVVTFSIPNNLR